MIRRLTCELDHGDIEQLAVVVLAEAEAGHHGDVVGTACFFEVYDPYLARGHEGGGRVQPSPTCPYRGQSSPWIYRRRLPNRPPTRSHGRRCSLLGEGLATLLFPPGSPNVPSRLLWTQGSGGGEGT